MANYIVCIKSVKKAITMFSLEVGDPLSFSVLIYSRKIIRDFIKRKNKISAVMDYPPGGLGSVKILKQDPKWILGPLLKALHRVNSEVNSNSVWDNPPHFLQEYKGKKQRVPTNSQYKSDYVSLVAGFDKMRYWLPVRYLADALHVRGLVKMDGEKSMGYVCFASLETNGTFLLVSGIIDDAMCSQDPRNCPFMREVNMFGMYAALIFAAHWKNKNTGTGTLYGSSKVPRHQHHNQGSSASLSIAGGKGLLLFEGTDKPKIVQHCRSVFSHMLHICQEAVTEMQSNRSTKKGSSVVASIAQSVYEDVQQQYVGLGIGHIFTLNFIPVASMFGFLPGKLATWACVESKTSGAYKAINALYRQEVDVITKQNGTSISKWREDIPVEDAEEVFVSAVKWLNQNVSYNCTASLAENILCELNRETGTLVKTNEQWASSPKKDVLYFYQHRKGAMHHLYRWKTDTKGLVTLQVLLVASQGDDAVTKNLTHLSVAGRKDEDFDMSIMAHWSGDPLGTQPVSARSQYILSDDYCKYFM
jgi:hypothetical protein